MMPYSCVALDELERKSSTAFFNSSVEVKKYPHPLQQLLYTLFFEHELYWSVATNRGVKTTNAANVIAIRSALFGLITCFMF